MNSGRGRGVLEDWPNRRNLLLDFGEFSNLQRFRFVVTANSSGSIASPAQNSSELFFHGIKTRVKILPLLTFATDSPMIDHDSPVREQILRNINVVESIDVIIGVNGF